jgi:16S rRNA (guanine527-N7)-methyltransferase
MEQLTAGAQAFGISLGDRQLEAFRAYWQMLVAWNARISLTTITDYREVLTRHFLDSLSCVVAVERDLANLRVVDIGSGAGFPGLPLKIAYQNLRLTLVEATGKKVTFLEAIVEQLGLAGVTVLHARAETAANDPAHREAYDLAVARAVGGLPVLAELMLPFVSLGGWMIAQKGEDPTAEAEAARSALKTLGGRLSRILPVTVPGLGAARHLVVIEKIERTPDGYPRRPGMPAKRPL